MITAITKGNTNFFHPEIQTIMSSLEHFNFQDKEDLDYHKTIIMNTLNIDPGIQDAINERVWFIYN